MDNTIIALQNFYLAMGGELTDSYEDICNGDTVNNYVTIPDMINAIANKFVKGAKPIENDDTPSN